MQDIRNNVLRIEEMEQNGIENDERWQQLQVCARSPREYVSTYNMFQEHMEMVLRIIAMKVYKETKTFVQGIWQTKNHPEQRKVYGRRQTDMELDEIVREAVIRLIYDQDHFMGGQEPTQIKSEPITNIKSEIDDNKSVDIQINQVV